MPDLVTDTVLVSVLVRVLATGREVEGLTA